MQVLIDGKEVECKNDIRVMYDGVIFGMDDDGNDEEGELHVILNCEGMVLDLISECEDGDAEVVGTMSQTYGEMAEYCI